MILKVTQQGSNSQEGTTLRSPQKDSLMWGSLCKGEVSFFGARLWRGPGM